MTVRLGVPSDGGRLMLAEGMLSSHRELADVRAAIDERYRQGYVRWRPGRRSMKLRDPQYTKVLLATLAETTPVSEAAHLQADVCRAQIEPHIWVINASLAAIGSSDPCLRQRGAAELEQSEQVRTRHANKLAIVPSVPEERVGPARLLALAVLRLPPI